MILKNLFLSKKKTKEEEDYPKIPHTPTRVRTLSNDNSVTPTTPTSVGSSSRPSRSLSSSPTTTTMQRHLSTVHWMTQIVKYSHHGDSFIDKNKDNVLLSYAKAAAFQKDASSASLPPINILCLDGGCGVKGLVLVELFKQLETTLGCENGWALSDVFDLVAGTSLGGVLALLFSHLPSYGQTTSTCETMFTDIAKECYAKTSWVQFLKTSSLIGNTQLGEIYRSYYGPDTILMASPSPRSSTNDNDKLENKNEGGLKVFAITCRKKTIPRTTSANSIGGRRRQRQRQRRCCNVLSKNILPPTTQSIKRIPTASKTNSTTATIACIMKYKKKRNKNGVWVFDNTKKTTTSGSGGRGDDYDYYYEDEQTVESFLLRTYEKPVGHSNIKVLPGTSSIKKWEAAVSTTAAPFYFPRSTFERQSKIKLMNHFHSSSKRYKSLQQQTTTPHQRQSSSSTTTNKSSSSQSMSSKRSLLLLQTQVGSLSKLLLETRDGSPPLQLPASTLKEQKQQWLSLDDDDNDEPTATSKVVHAVDGAVIANNPTAHAIHEACLLYPNRKLGMVISLGTGKIGSRRRGRRGRYGLLDKGERNGGMQEAIESVGGKYIRLNPPLETAATRFVKMESSCPQVVLQQIQDDVQTYTQTSKEFKMACEFLKQYVNENPTARGRHSSNKSSTK